MKIFQNLKDFGLNTSNKVYIVAEIGINHGGSIDLARKLIESAARTGVDAVKFQTYITEKRAAKGSPIFDILKKCELPFKTFSQLKEYSDQLDLEFFSTPFDNESVDFLESIKCKIIKVASFDVVNVKFLSRIAKTHKPIILSVGMSNVGEIRKAYNILRKGTRKIALLHCISAYPTDEKDANLAAIHSLKQEFDCVIGQSDHTSDIKVPLYAVAAGAQVLEKHYKIEDNMDCVDAPVSISERQMKEMVVEVRKLEQTLGDGKPRLTVAQKPIKVYRRYSKQ